MNTPRTKEIRRYDKERHPKNPDLPNLAIFGSGVEDEEIRSLLGELVSTWSHLEEAMVYIFATLSGTPRQAPSREMFRSIIAQDVKIKMMRFLLQETEANALQPPFFDKAIDEFESLNRSRNKYIHGLWYNYEGRTYLASTDPARHPFETVTRKVDAPELQNFLNRARKLVGAIIEYHLFCDPDMQTGTEWPEQMKAHHEQIRLGNF